MTEPRASFESLSAALPDVVAALRTLSHASAQGLDKGLVELVKVRASQINGCAYCLQVHLNWARKAGVPQVKLDRVAAWREAPGFEAQERAALAWTEAVTGANHHGGTDAAYLQLQEAFDAHQVLLLTATIATINAWNRIAGPLAFEPPAAV